MNVEGHKLTIVNNNQTTTVLLVCDNVEVDCFIFAIYVMIYMYDMFDFLRSFFLYYFRCAFTFLPSFLMLVPFHRRGKGANVPFFCCLLT